MGCCASAPAAPAGQASKDSLSEYLPKASLTPRSVSATRDTQRKDGETRAVRASPPGR